LPTVASGISPPRFGSPFAIATLGDRLGQVISFRSVTANGSGGPVVDALSFEAASHAITVVLATPVATRRAIAYLANGVERPTSGAVFVDEVDTAKSKMLKRRRAMGWVAGPVRLFPHRTVLQQISTAARLAGAGRRRAKLEAQAALVYERLTNLGSAYPDDLSPSDRVRAAFARAYCHNPDVMVLLDPFEGVDATDRAQLRQELLDAQKRNVRTVLLATGDPEDAIDVADWVHVVVDGQLLQSATPADLLARPFDDRVANLLGANRGIRRLRFTLIDSLQPDEQPIVHVEGTTEEARAAARSGSPWVLIVDDERYPVGWLDTTGLREQGRATDVPLVTVDADATVRDGDSLSVAFDRILSSPSRLVAKLSPDGKAVGVFAHDDIAGMASEAMS
jgi:ABC-type proline/glycine betaine transport system ATPase subunit